MVENIKQYLLDEIEGKMESSFIYKLDKENYFDEKKLNILLEKTDSFLKNTSINEPEYMDILQGLFNVFLHSIFLFYCNNSPDDYYKIVNYNDSLNSEKITNFYLKIKDIIFA